MKKCNCHIHSQPHRRIVITGGPGAGKTALLEIARKNLCEHVAILPESATIIFMGGFWRHNSMPSLKATQRAIYHVQRELEQMVEEENQFSVALCDRGTLDGLAYWPADDASFWQEIGSSQAIELSRYSAVIHLRTPLADQGYNNSNPVRIETVKQALEIDKKIEKVWEQHPRRFFVESGDNFLEKVQEALKILSNEIPECCLQANK